MTDNQRKLSGIVQNLRYLELQAERSGFNEMAVFIGAARLSGMDIKAKDIASQKVVKQDLA